MEMVMTNPENDEMVDKIFDEEPGDDGMMGMMGMMGGMGGMGGGMGRSAGGVLLFTINFTVKK